jgi:ABC-type xylose transport system permease subunit
MKNSQFVSLVALFAALNVVCDSVSVIPQFGEYSVWLSWNFLIEPITGIVLGPYAGFLSNFIGVMIGHFMYYRGIPEFLFTLGAPVGAMVSGLLFRGKWKTVFACYTVMFIAYFATPVAWQLPIWGMWNTYLAYVALCTIAFVLTRKKMEKFRSKRFTYSLVLYAFIGLEADILCRIFILVPCQTYRLIYGWPIQTLQGVWMLGAAVTPIQVALSALVVTPLVGVPITKLLRKKGFLQFVD